MSADHILRTLVPQGSHLTVLRAMSDELHARGCTFLRANPWPEPYPGEEPNNDGVLIVEGWFVRPDDQGEVPPRDAGEAWPPARPSAGPIARVFP